MSRFDALVHPNAIEYITAFSLRESPPLARLRQETAKLPNNRMQIPPEQAQLLQILVRMIGAKRTIEIGVFTGYSSLAVALALPIDGKVVACDLSEEYTRVARRHWAEAGVAGKIDLRIGPAAATLEAMICAGESAQYDFVFIDADKTGYPAYYEQSLKLVRKGGVIALDNMLKDGRVWDPAATDADTAALRWTSEFIHRDERVDALLLSIADGVTIAVKR